MTSPSSNTEVPSLRQERKAKITPLPLSQMIPMTIVIMNESICSTMLMPFIGPLVAFLRGVPVNEAGYFSGAMIGMFMLGQVVSAKTWGRISDKYGRRFPLISGLFTSGLMMLGFGLSTNVWLLAVFRFFQGLFNGNVLVAKTMMADITDRTNQAGGFSFMSLCNAFGFLIGPGIGGLLYDPTKSKILAWAGFDKHGFFATHPAFLTSLVVFIYTIIGMLVCTFLVKESNPKAQPLPGFVRFIYPCLWYKSEPFVLPPIQYEDEAEDEDEDEVTGVMVSVAAENTRDGARRASDVSDSPCQDGVDGADKRGRGGTGFSDIMVLPSQPNAVLTVSHATVVPPTYSLVERDGSSGHDFDPVKEASAIPATTPHNKQRFTSPLEGLDDGKNDEAKQYVNAATVLVDLRRGKQEGSATEATAPSTRSADYNDEEEESEEKGGAAAGDESHDVEAVVMTRFGYREAFARPYTRFMLSQYMVLSATDMMARDCFPLWAVATTSVGGLGLSSSQVSYILLANSAPCLAANLLFRVVERYFVNRMGLLRVGVIGAGMAVVLLPLSSYLGDSFWVYALVFLCSAGRQVFCSWCYSLNTMLTARSAPPGHVGSIMGINQSCGALVRGIVPFVAAPLFAWSISGDHVFPFNHVLVFFISSLLFYSCWWRSYSIRTDANCNLQMVD